MMYIIKPQGIYHPPLSNNSEVEKILSHGAFMPFSVSMNAMMTCGAIKMELAKMTGITPAELILIGKNEARAIL